MLLLLSEKSARRPAPFEFRVLALTLLLNCHLRLLAAVSSCSSAGSAGLVSSVRLVGPRCVGLIALCRRRLVAVAVWRVVSALCCVSWARRACMCVYVCRGVWLAFRLLGMLALVVLVILYWLANEVTRAHAACAFANSVFAQAAFGSLGGSHSGLSWRTRGKLVVSDCLTLNA